MMAVGVFPRPRREAADDERLAAGPLVLLFQQHQQRLAVDAARLARIVENDFISPDAEIEEKRAVADVEVMVRQRRIGEHAALPWIRKPVHVNVIGHVFRAAHIRVQIAFLRPADGVVLRRSRGAAFGNHQFRRQFQFVLRAVFQFHNVLIETSFAFVAPQDDKVAIIKQGKLIRSGTMEEVKGDDSLEVVFEHADELQQPRAAFVADDFAAGQPAGLLRAVVEPEIVRIRHEADEKARPLAVDDALQARRQMQRVPHFLRLLGIPDIVFVQIRDIQIMKGFRKYRHAAQAKRQHQSQSRPSHSTMLLLL